MLAMATMITIITIVRMVATTVEAMKTVMAVKTITKEGDGVAIDRFQKCYSTTANFIAYIA